MKKVGRQSKHITATRISAPHKNASPQGLEGFLICPAQQPSRCETLTDIAEGQQQLVFVKDDKVVSVAVLDREIIDFLQLEDNYYGVNTLFKVKFDNGQYRIIAESN